MYKEGSKYFGFASSQRQEWPEDVDKGVRIVVVFCSSFSTHPDALPSFIFCPAPPLRRLDLTIQSERIHQAISCGAPLANECTAIIVSNGPEYCIASFIRPFSSLILLPLWTFYIYRLGHEIWTFQFEKFEEFPFFRNYLDSDLISLFLHIVFTSSLEFLKAAIDADNFFFSVFIFMYVP